MKINHRKRVQIAVNAQAAADRSVAAIDDALAFVAASNSRIDAMEIQRQLFGLVERDLTRDVYIGKIIGFPHIEFEAVEVGEVISKLQEYTAKLDNSESLVLETEFVQVFRL
jgi:cob(I)alamin adenosyltransferase